MNTDTQRLEYLERLFRETPHAKIYINEDPDLEDDDGALIPLGVTISIVGCVTVFATRSTLSEAIDAMIAENYDR